MHKIDGNKSDHSLDTSVARSSSGVSTQKSVDGLADDKDSECVLVYGNVFSKCPHPEIIKAKGKRLSSQTTSNEFDNENDDKIVNHKDSVNTVDRSISIKNSSKPRRHSEAHLRSFSKRKHGDSKRKSTSEDSPAASTNIEKLLSTLNDFQERQLSGQYDDIDGAANRTNQKLKALGDIQSVIKSTSMLGTLSWTHLQEAMIHRAEQSPKELFLALLDSSGKYGSNTILNYSKLYKRSQRICYHITNKINSDQFVNLRPGKSVGLVFGYEDVIDFVVAFFACMLAKVIAVPVEKPTSSQFGSSSITGKYLSQLGVDVILTNLICFREMTRKNADIREIAPWGEMLWISIDSYYSEKVPKGYCFPDSCSTFTAPLYVEYVYSDGNVLRGVPVTMEATLCHCQTLKDVCNYEQGQMILCTDNIKRQTGLWHSVLTALYCGIGSYILPYTLVKKNPVLWFNAVSKYKIVNVVTSSRVLHHSLSVDVKDFPHNLSQLNNLLVADASVPWINETLNRFIQKFTNFGLKMNSVVPCVSSSETLTVCMRRRSENDKSALPKLKLCAEYLSYNLIKEITNESTSLSTLHESSGCLLPSMQAVLIGLEEQVRVCREDEIGEICVQSPFSNRVFWMTPAEVSDEILTINLKMQNYDDSVVREEQFARTGLIGFFRKFNDQDHIFIYGSKINFIEIDGHTFNTDDIIGTVSVVKPLGILHKSRCCVFVVPIMCHNRLVIAVEIDNSKYSDDKIYDWISNVLQAVLNLHQVNVYCVVGIQTNSFPKSLLGDISITETKSRFISGHLNISHLMLCPQTAIPSILGERRSSNQSYPPAAASMLAHAFHAHSFASIYGSQVRSSQRTMLLTEILEWRATHTPDDPLISIIGPKLSATEQLTCDQIHRRVQRVASLLKDKLKSVIVGSVVAVMLSDPLELLYAIYGCYYIGVIPLILSVPYKESSMYPFVLSENLWATKHSKAVICLTSASTIRFLKSKDSTMHVPADMWPNLVNSSDPPSKRPISPYNVSSPEKELALIRLHIDQSGVMTLPAWTHANISALCDAFKSENEFSPGSEIVLCLNTLSNAGLFLHCLSSVYCGCHTLVVTPTVMDMNPDTWLELVCRKTIKHTFCSEKALSQSILATKNTDLCSFYKKPGLNLQHVESLIVCVSDRPNHVLIRDFLNIFDDTKFGLSTLSIGLDSPWTLGLFLQIPKSSYPRTVYLDRSAIRNNRITENQDDSPMEVLESGVPFPNSSVFVVDYQSGYQKSINQLGEFWIVSEYACKTILAAATAKNLEDIYKDVLNVSRLVCDSDSCEALSDNVLSARLALGETIQSPLVRTGLIGFLRSFVGAENQLVVLGKVDDTMNIRGFSYFPSEVEFSIGTVDPVLIIKSIVFSEADLVIAVIEVTDNCRPEICLRMVPIIVKAVLENCLIALSIVQFVKRGQLPTDISCDRRKVKSLWLRKLFDSQLQFYCL